MRYRVLATDYDGTLAHDGRVDERTVEGVERLRASGRRLVLVTGRIRVDLERTFARPDLFDLVVAENGATLWRPGGAERLLAAPPPPALLASLRSRGVPFDTGHVVVATTEPHDPAVVAAIHELGLDLQLVFNKGAVMVLPPGVTKASGLAAALDALGPTHHEVVAVGDAENDLVMLAAAECGVAVHNALPAVKAAADLVTRGARGAGVVEVADALLADDLAHVDPRRHHVPLGASAAGAVTLSPAATVALVAGPRGAARRAVTRVILERLVARGYQLCIVDPEGDLRPAAGVAPLGSAGRAPDLDEVVAVLGASRASVAFGLEQVAPAERPRLVQSLAARVEALRRRTGRPHWLALGAADELLPRGSSGEAGALRGDLGGVLLVTARPEGVAPAVLREVGTAIAAGDGSPRTLTSFAAAAGLDVRVPVSRPGDLLLWRRGGAATSLRLAAEDGARELRP